MTSRTRRMMVGILLGIYLLWPFVHQQLVLRYRINPWKLAGWAMYTTMLPRGNMVVSGVDDTGARVPLDVRSHRDLSRTRSAYMSQRLMLGLFIDPSPVAIEAARAFPQFESWEITVNEVGLSERSYIETIHRSIYHFERSANGIEQTSATHEVPPVAGGSAQG